MHFVKNNFVARWQRLRYFRMSGASCSHEPEIPDEEWKIPFSSHCS